LFACVALGGAADLARCHRGVEMLSSSGYNLAREGAKTYYVGFVFAAT
jgi:hypothetical protein